MSQGKSENHQSNADFQSKQIKQEDRQQSKQLAKAKNPTKMNNKKGSWTTDQNLKYAVFLQFNKDKFQHLTKRKAWIHYKKMSSFVGQRDVNQCRNHHRKLMEKYHSLTDMIQDLINRFEENELDPVRNSYLELSEFQKSSLKPNTISKMKIVKQQEKIKKNQNIQIEQTPFKQKKKLQQLKISDAPELAYSTFPDYRYCYFRQYWQNCNCGDYNIHIQQNTNK